VHGCAIVSVSIIATGFGNDVTPIDVNNYYRDVIKSANHARGLSYYTNRSCEYVYSNIKAGIISQLSKGYPVFVHVKSNSGRFSTNGGHFFTILSISPNKDMVYVSDPVTHSSERNGWLPISILDDRAFDKYMKME